MSEPKATRIVIDYDNGETWQATGEAADRIMSWWRSCEMMNCIHGAKYDGPGLQPVVKVEAKS